MRKALLAAMAALMLSGCVSMLDDTYDDRARRECDRGATSDRSRCYDDVDQRRRENNRRYGD